jgi:hypothetical protein
VSVSAGEASVDTHPWQLAKGKGKFPEPKKILAEEKIFSGVRAQLVSNGSTRMTERPLITLGFSSHRMEVLPYEQEEMWRHDAVVLEEAPEPGFIDVLSKNLDLESYLENQDREFPEFTRRQLERLQELHQARKAIYQIEPYLERVVEIHTMLTQGASPQEVVDRSHLKPVYETEKQVDGLLLKFYACSHTASFQRVVIGVKEFARADATRFRLRDELRAQALVPLIDHFSRIYVEAGYIHLYLVKTLRRLLSGKARLRPLFLMASQVRPQLRVPRPLGPGDLLTLSYIFQRGISGELEELLAARSLIYIKLLQKIEMAPEEDTAPHLNNEIKAYHLTEDLSFEDCNVLYPRIKFASPEESQKEVQHYLLRHYR